jgi:hypothetical protein
MSFSEESVGSIIAVPCGTCLVKTNHIVLESAIVEGGNEEYDYWYKNNYQIIKCLGCSLVSFRKTHTNNMDSDTYENPDGTFTEVPIIKVELFPVHMEGRSKLKNAYMLPPLVRRVYEEVHKALGNQLPILASAGIRTLIESICHEKQAKGNNLKEKIDSLVALSVLTLQGAEILHFLRDLGNDSVHEFKTLDQDILEKCLDVIEPLLQNVYIIPRLASEIKKKKK